MKAFRRFLLSFILAVLLFALVIGSLGYGKYRYAVKVLPVTDAVQEVRDRPGYVNILDLPPLYVNGVVAVEDHRFFSHPGYDVLAILRAAKNDLLAHRFVEGGSTITQQLVKNLYFNHDKDILRKVAEIFLAREFEERYTKKEILELYVNCIYFGRECYGISDASRTYYDKFPWDLTPKEITILIGLPNGPKYFDPKRNPEGARERQERVVRDLVKRKVITKEEGKTILEE